MGEIADALRRDRNALDTTKANPMPAQPVVDSPRSREMPSLDEITENRPERRSERGLEASSERPASERPLETAAAPEPAPVRTQVISRDEDRATLAARISVVDPQNPASHRYRHMATRVQRAASAARASTIVITSPQMGDGKTTTACNLAVQLSRLDRSRHVALVDLDLRHPAVARSLGLDPKVQIGDVLAGTATLEEARIPTDVVGLDVYAASRGMRGVDDLLSSNRIMRLIDSLERSYSMVLLDTPPVLVAADASAILTVAPAGLLVASAGSCSTRAIEESLAQIPREKMLGSCINRSRAAQGSTASGYGYEGYSRPEDLEDVPPLPPLEESPDDSNVKEA